MLNYVERLRRSAIVLETASRRDLSGTLNYGQLHVTGRPSTWVKSLASDLGVIE